MTDFGRFYWYDLITTDVEAAKSFYTKLMGWGTMAFETPGQPYTMWMNGEAPIGGVGVLPEEARKAGAPPYWISYVLVPNVDDTLRQAQKLGGKVVVPGTDIPTVGRFGILEDPQGVQIAVFTTEKPSPESPPGPGNFSWNELATTDPVAAFSFYQQLFGWEQTEAMDMGEIGLYRMYKRKGGDFPVGGVFKRPAEMPVSSWCYYALVKDVNQSVADVKRLGGQVLNGPMEVPGGDLIAQCLDPQRAFFALHSKKP